MLLHEGLGCVAMWKDFPERLAAATGCNVFAYSRAGYGRSSAISLPRPLDYMQREGLEVVSPILTAMNFSCCVLIGHSDGASIAIVNAGGVRDPRVRGLVLMAPHVFAEETGLRSIEQARIAYAETNLRERLAKYHGANVDNAFKGWCDAWLDPGFRAWNIEHFLPPIAVPSLLIQGVDDQYGTRLQLDRIAGQVKGEVETQLLADCKHAPHFEQPERTLQLNQAFVNRVLGITAPKR